MDPVITDGISTGAQRSEHKANDPVNSQKEIFVEASTCRLDRPIRF
jgi:hypothetical protein